MKRKIAALSFILLFILSGCRGENAAQRMSGENNVIVAVVNNTDIPLAILRIEWYAGDDPVGRQETGHTDGTAIRKGELCPFELLASDMPKGRELSFEITVFGEDGREYLLPSRIPIRVEYGEIYTVELSGSTLEDLTAARRFE